MYLCIVRICRVLNLLHCLNPLISMCKSLSICFYSTWAFDYCGEKVLCLYFIPIPLQQWFWRHIAFKFYQRFINPFVNWSPASSHPGSPLSVANVRPTSSDSCIQTSALYSYRRVFRYGSRSWRYSLATLWSAIGNRKTFIGFCTLMICVELKYILE